MAVIFFDGDQTLWDFQALMRRTQAATIKELRRQVPALEGDLSVEEFVADREAVAGQLRGKVTSLESVRLAAFTRSLQRLGIQDAGLAQHLNDFYLRRRFAGVDLYDDVLPVLGILIRDHAVGLLSNGNSYPEQAGLQRLFTATVFSQDHGVEKPDPRIYAIAQAAIPGGEYIMVGDSLINDVVAAQDVGWRGIWLNRDRRVLPTGIRPDAIVADLHELLTLIDPADLSLLRQQSAVVHCLGGKDRTGMAIALLLTALGVDRGTVLDDYELTSRCHASRVPEVVEAFTRLGIGRSAGEALMSTPRWAMAQALRELDQAHGGIRQYLLGPGGISPQTLSALRANLVG